MEQKKYVIITNAIEALTKLKAEKRLEGVLFIDKTNGSIKFKAYNRKSPKHPKDRLICPLETGWLKESRERIKFFSSVKKEVGVAEIHNAMESDLEKAMNELFMMKLQERLF